MILAMDIEDNHKIAEQAVVVDDLATEPTERRALEAQGSVVQLTVDGCPSCDNAPRLWYVDGHWVFDTDDGYRGPTIRFCPMCGIELPND